MPTHVIPIILTLSSRPVIIMLSQRKTLATENGTEINRSFGRRSAERAGRGIQSDSRNDLEATDSSTKRDPRVSWPLLPRNSILGIPGGFFCFCFERNRGSRVWGHIDDESAREICARAECTSAANPAAFLASVGTPGASLSLSFSLVVERVFSFRKHAPLRRA